MVILDPTTHSYIDEDDIKYKSVTTFINEFVPEFNFEEKSKSYATKYGLNVEEVRASWKLKNKLSTDFGTKIHKEIENLINGGSFAGEKLHKNSIESIVERVIKDFKPGDFFLERTVFNKEYKTAGTADLIVDKQDTFSIVDFKTNKEIKMSSIYDKFLKQPVTHLHNGEFFKYSLQLSFYAYFYHLETGKQLDRLCIYWLNRKKTDLYTDLTKSEWVRYNLPYLKEEVMDCLEYAKKN